MQQKIRNFYPRSPRGERHCIASRVSYHPDFYPRSPRGERPGCPVWLWPKPQFLSTLPAWGATGTLATGITVKAFLSTLPAWGATLCRPEVSASPQFLSTLPAWGATIQVIQDNLGLTDFYPRSPRGERQQKQTKIIIFFVRYRQSSREIRFPLMISAAPRCVSRPSKSSFQGIDRCEGGRENRNDSASHRRGAIPEVRHPARIGDGARHVPPGSGSDPPDGRSAGCRWMDQSKKSVCLSARHTVPR